MTKAPERIWAYEHCEQVTAARSSVMFPSWAEAYEYIRADHALAMVADEREACAKAAINKANHVKRFDLDDMKLAYRRIAAKIRARTNADAQAKLERREQWIRNEALREAANLAKYEGEEFAGMREGVMFDRLSKKILALITEDQSDE